MFAPTIGKKYDSASFSLFTSARRDHWKRRLPSAALCWDDNRKRKVPRLVAVKQCVSRNILALWRGRDAPSLTVVRVYYRLSQKWNFLAISLQHQVAVGWLVYGFQRLRLLKKRTIKYRIEDFHTNTVQTSIAKFRFRNINAQKKSVSSDSSTRAYWTRVLDQAFQTTLAEINCSTSRQKKMKRKQTKEHFNLCCSVYGGEMHQTT